MRFSKVVAAAAIIACVAAAGGEVKLVTSFEDEAILEKISGPASKALSDEHVTDGKKSLKVMLAAKGSSIDLIKLLGMDWGGWEYLKLDVYNPGPPVTMTLRTDDRLDGIKVAADPGTISSWYHYVRTGKTTLEFVVPMFAEKVRLDDMKKIDLRCDTELGDRKAELWLDNLRFVKGEGIAVFEKPETKVVRKVGAVPGNLITNGDFEFGFMDWGSWGLWDGGKYGFATGSGDDAWSGSASAAIVCVKRGRGGISQGPIRLPADGSYLVSIRYKGTDGAIFRPYVEGLLDERIQTDGTWKPFEKTFQGKAGVDVRLFCFNVGTGILYVDAVSIVPKDGAAAEKKEFRFPDGLKASKIEIRNEQILVNGEPFFCFGFYCCPTPEDLKDTGFNYAMAHEIGSTPLEHLEACRKAGVMTPVNLTGLMRGHLPYLAGDVAGPYANHPSVLGWYLCDEPDHEAWGVPTDEMEAARRLLRAKTAQPTLSVIMPWAESNLYRYARCLDIMTTDIYPDSVKQIQRVAHDMDVLQRAAPRQPRWTVIWPKDAKYNVVATYLALAHRATGVVYWHYGMIEGKEKGAAKADWPSLKQLSMEVKALRPYLVEPTVDEKVASSDERVHAAPRAKGNSRVVLSINTAEEKAAGVRLTLAGKLTGKAKVLFEDRTVDVVEGVIADDFEPCARHVYEIGK